MLQPTSSTNARTQLKRPKEFQPGASVSVPVIYNFSGERICPIDVNVSEWCMITLYTPGGHCKPLPAAGWSRVFGNEKRGAPRRLLIWSYNQLAGWGASADGKTLTVVALKHDTADDDGREKTREFSTEAGVSAAIATLLTDYVGAYRSQRAEMLAAREPEPEPDAASDV